MTLPHAYTSENSLDPISRSRAIFERFTDRARKCLQIANQEAVRLNHEDVQPVHVLLGILKEGSGVGSAVLKNLEVNEGRLREQALAILPVGTHTVQMGKLPLAPMVNRAIQQAIEEAKNLNHNYVGTEHLLLGLLVAPETRLVLHPHGVTVEAVREEILLLLGHDIQAKPGDEGSEYEVHTWGTSGLIATDSLHKLPKKVRLMLLEARVATLEARLELLVKKLDLADQKRENPK